MRWIKSDEQMKLTKRLSLFRISATRLVWMMGRFGNIARDFQIGFSLNFPRMVLGVCTRYKMCQIGWTNEIVETLEHVPNIRDSTRKNNGEFHQHCSRFPPWIFSKFFEDVPGSVYSIYNVSNWVNKWNCGIARACSEFTRLANIGYSEISATLVETSPLDFL